MYTDNATYASTRWVPAVRERIIYFLPVIRRHFLACKDVVGGSQLSGAGIRRHFLPCKDIRGGSQLSGGGIILFSRNKEAVACVRPWTWCVPTVSLSMYRPLPTTLI